MADNNLQASFRKLMRYAQNLAEYEQGIAEGIIDENVFVIVLDEKVAKFKGQTFDWSGNGSGGGGGDGGSDSSSFRTIYIGEADELTEEQKQYNIETRNRIINDDNAPVIALGNALGTPGMHSSNGEIKSVSVTFKLIMELEAAYMVALINADGTVTIESEYYAPIYCVLRNAEHAYIFFGTRDIFYEAKGIITGEDGTMYEVDAYNLESHFVEYNKGDKRYRVMFDESYNITEEIDITPSNGEGGETDTSNLATKEEVQNLTDEIIANEEVHAAALNDLEERKADKEYVEQYVEDAITSAITTALNTEV